MGLFSKRGAPPSADAAQRELTQLQDALKRTEAELTAQQGAHEAAVREIGQLRARAAMADEDERAQLQQQIEDLTRERLLLTQIDIATSQHALTVLREQVTTAEDVATLASLTEQRNQLDALIARYHELSDRLDGELETTVLPMVKELGRLSHVIESRLNPLRSLPHQWGLEVPHFDKGKVVNTAGQRIGQAWFSGTEQRLPREPEDRPAMEPEEPSPVRVTTPMPDRASVGEGVEAFEYVNDQGHRWSGEPIPQGTDTCQQCHLPTAGRCVYQPHPSEKEWSWLYCESHYQQFQRKHARQVGMAR